MINYRNSKLPYLEFCITTTMLNTNYYNSNPPQKLELAHFFKYKDDKTINTSAPQTNIQVLLCKVLPASNGRKSSRKYNRYSRNASSIN